MGIPFLSYDRTSILVIVTNYAVSTSSIYEILRLPVNFNQRVSVSCNMYLA